MKIGAGCAMIRMGQTQGYRCGHHIGTPLPATGAKFARTR
jgi:hypothetical protein